MGESCVITNIYRNLKRKMLKGYWKKPIISLTSSTKRYCECGIVCIIEVTLPKKKASLYIYELDLIYIIAKTLKPLTTVIIMLFKTNPLRQT